MNEYFDVHLLWALIYISILVLCLCLNAAGAPGNWIMLGFATFYSILMPSNSPYGFGFIVVFIVFLSAVIGEVLEFFTGAISTKRAGGSKRSVWFSIIGSVFGSIAGIFIGIPIPIIGSLIAALLFSGVGALLGAYYGERVEGRSSQDAWNVGVSSFMGRVLGALFKILFGFIALICMVVAMLV